MKSGFPPAVTDDPKDSSRPSENLKSYLVYNPQILPLRKEISSISSGTLNNILSTCICMWHTNPHMKAQVTIYRV